MMGYGFMGMSFFWSVLLVLLVGLVALILVGQGRG
jgi:hypothetical protein